jgi:hypothetical protein
MDLVLFCRYSSQHANVKHFVGQILSLQPGELTEVKFLKNAGSEKFKWPEQDDVDIVPLCDIITVLPEPQMDRRDLLSFATSPFSYIN